MAKSKSAAKSTANIEKRANNAIVQQWRGLRSEVRKVTWPTREEALVLTRAIVIGTVIVAIFLYLIDALYQVVIGGIVGLDIAWIVAALVTCGLLAYAFYANAQEE